MFLITTYARHKIYSFGAAILFLFVLSGYASSAFAQPDEALLKQVADTIEAALAERDANELLRRVDELWVEGGPSLEELAERVGRLDEDAARGRRALAEALAEEAVSGEEAKRTAKALAKARTGTATAAEITILEEANTGACGRYQRANYRFTRITARSKDFAIIPWIEFGGLPIEPPEPGTLGYEEIRRPLPGSDSQIRSGQRIAAEIVTDLDAASLRARQVALTQRAAALRAAALNAGNPTARFYLRLLGQYSGWNWAATTRAGAFVGRTGAFAGGLLGRTVAKGSLGPVGWALLFVDVAIAGVQDYIEYDDQQAIKETSASSHKNLLEVQKITSDRALAAREADAAAALKEALKAAKNGAECRDVIQQAIEQAQRDFTEASDAEKELQKKLDKPGENDAYWHPRRFRASTIRNLYEAAQTARVNAAKRLSALHKKKKDCPPDTRIGLYLGDDNGQSCSAQNIAYRASPFAMLRTGSLVMDAPHAYVPYDDSRQGPPECSVPGEPEDPVLFGAPIPCLECACEPIRSVPPPEQEQPEEDPVEPEMVTVGIKATQSAIAGGEGESFAGGMIQFNVGPDPALPVAGNPASDFGYAEGAYKAITGEDGQVEIEVPAYAVAADIENQPIEVTLNEHSSQMVVLENESKLDLMWEELSEELKGYRSEPFAMNGLVIVPFMFPKNRLDTVLEQLEQLENVAYIEKNQCWPIQPRLGDAVVFPAPSYPTQSLNFE